MTFAEDLHIIPNYPITDMGRGVIPPMIRITTHLSDILSDLINSREWSPADQQAGMDQLRAHALGLATDADTLSRQANDRLVLLKAMTTRYANEFPQWSRERPDHLQSEAVRNTQELLNRIAAIGVFLDVELASIPADAGRNV